MDKVILITGASRGLGEATARWLGKAGCRLGLNARSEDRLNALAAQIGADRCLVLPGDVSDPTACKDAVDKMVAQFGRLDGLINNAGVIEPIGPMANIDPQAWWKNLAINLLGPMASCHAAIPELRKTEGRVVNVSTGAAVHAISGWTAYCASKAGLHHLTRTLAVEEPDISFYSLRPGVIDTDMQSIIRRDGPGLMPAEMATYFQSLKDQNRLEPPEVPGRALAWLALHGPKDWTGEFIEYGDAKVANPALAEFGDKL